MKSHRETIINRLLDATGISKRSLADFLGVNHSLLTRHDDGSRMLPTGALLQVVEMGKHLTEPAPLPAPALSEKEKEDLIKKANWCRHQCYPLRKKLEAMELAQQQAANTIKMADALLPLAANASELSQKWLELQHFSATIMLRKNGWLIQRKLEIQIELLEKEAALYESAANGPE